MQDWTHQEDAELRRLHATGISFAQIAEGMPGRARSACIGRAQRIGLTRYRAPPVKELSQRRKEQRIKDALAKRIKRAALRLLNPPKVAVQRPKTQPTPRPVNDLRETAKHLTFTEADFKHQCAFPYGDGPFTFCGHPKARGESYCAPHVLYCTGAGTPSEKVAHKYDRRVREAA